MDKILTKNFPILLIGNTGTGKTSIITNYLNQLATSRYSINCINFSARTTCTQIQETIISKLKRVKKGIYSAEGDRTSVYFVDDLNMPSSEKYGAQPPIELLRSLIDHEFVYEPDENTKMEIKKSLVVGAFVPTGSGRNEVTSRFLRHFNIISIESFNDDLFRTIFHPIMEWHFDMHEQENDFHLYSPMMMIDATLNIYNRVLEIFLPTPSKSHYLFNSRDFSRVINVFFFLN